MPPTVAVFTDTYLPTVNGVTYTIRAWRERWHRRGGLMQVVYPGTDGHDPEEGEHPVRSVAFPYYEGFHVGLPAIPDALTAPRKTRGSGVPITTGDTPEGTTDGTPAGTTDGTPVSTSGGATDGGSGIGDAPDVVHAHTPFLLGLSGLWCARRLDVPLVASYHTPTAEYADYLADGLFSRVVEGVARNYERWFMNRADAVVVPSEPAREHLRAVGVRAPIEIVPNGVDLETFRPVDSKAFRERHDLPDGPLVGYTGRHGYEKNLDEILSAVDGFGPVSGGDSGSVSGGDSGSVSGGDSGSGVTVVFAGDGPARERLEDRAAELDADVRFLGFLDREELPAFYSALDVFAFPSPVETQGLVALEAIACGTPVVGANEGALAETVVDGETGYNYESGDPADFRAKIERTLDERDGLGESCLARRDELGVDRAVDRLAEVYGHLLRR